ncbi:MAG TPA: GTP 3',8-cyclase MoaA [Candidatus Kapabacteria bacterium]|nr:GTP 3',8-cyclase MoaA [Candidatus Kapabacteria bacterium]
MLIDQYQRVHDYLRISVTERCNFRCTYCMPAEGVALTPNGSLLTYPEISTLAEMFVRLGIRKIRITGGEPLVRPNIEHLCFELSRIRGLRELAISTNGFLLEEKLSALFHAGVRQLNISLDSLRPERFERITRRNNFERVVMAIRAAVQFQSGRGSGFDSVKINTVVMRGMNDDELLDLIRFGIELEQRAKRVTANPPAIEIRFIELMPFPGNGWNNYACVPFSEMRRAIELEYRLEAIPNAVRVRGPAKRFRIPETGTTIGFITTMSDHFCGDCNRLRLTADGMLRTCLFGSDEINLRELLRGGASMDTIESAIHAALALKWEKHPGAAELIQINDRDMVAIGG